MSTTKTSLMREMSAIMSWRPNSTEADTGGKEGNDGAIEHRGKGRDEQ